MENIIFFYHSRITLVPNHLFTNYINDSQNPKTDIQNSSKTRSTIQINLHIVIEGLTIKPTT